MAYLEKYHYHHISIAILILEGAGFKEILPQQGHSKVLKAEGGNLGVA